MIFKSLGTAGRREGNGRLGRGGSLRTFFERRQHANVRKKKNARFQRFVCRLFFFVQSGNDKWCCTTGEREREREIVFLNTMRALLLFVRCNLFERFFLNVSPTGIFIEIFKNFIKAFVCAHPRRFLRYIVFDFSPLFPLFFFLKFIIVSNSTFFY